MNINAKIWQDEVDYKFHYSATTIDADGKEKVIEEFPMRAILELLKQLQESPKCSDEWDYCKVLWRFF